MMSRIGDVRAQGTDEEDSRRPVTPARTRAPTDASSPAYALLRGLRMRGNEHQVTQAIAALSQSDERFALALVRLLLRVAATDGRHARNVALMGEPPEELSCVAELNVYDQHDLGVGRVDLRFHGDDFTLIVENKLHSGFGHQQLARYQAALRALPASTRAGLLAVTADVPSHGELDAGSDGWLGAVRWARLYDEGLADLPISHADVRTQWRSLVEILHDEGDLGLTSVDVDLITAWSRYEAGQAHLAALLNGIRQRTLDALRESLAPKRYSAGGRRGVADFHHFGIRERQPIKTQKSAVWTGFRVPADINRPVIRLSFWSDGATAFSVEVAPWQAAERIAADERQIRSAAARLHRDGFQADHWYGEYLWWHEYRAEDFLDRVDVSARLLELIESDINAIAGSGILAHDFRAAAKGGRAGPPKVRTRSSTPR
jgi:hypothetical protein